MAYTTIKKPSDYFNTKLYTGTGSSLAITGVGFQSDLTWLKRRNGTAYHWLIDAVRGSTKVIYSNGTEAEQTQSQGITSFDSDGFTLGTNSDVNGSSDTYASWNWLANNTTGASNTDGSITSTVSANTTAGFSICKWTGTGANATIGHGLSAVPKMIIAKRLSNTEDWTIYHTSLGATKKIDLNNTGAESTVANIWNNTAPTSSVFYVGDHNRVNGSGDTYVAYCFADVTGYSKFGSYTGNGNADGSFIYTGFKPAFINIKRTDSLGQWNMFDIARADVPNANGNDQVIYSNSSDAELSSTTREIDLLSNGFKCRATGGDINASGGSYIYMIFAEEPLVGDNPATAR
jgi:hypothetical protein